MWTTVLCNIVRECTAAKETICSSVGDRTIYEVLSTTIICSAVNNNALQCFKRRYSAVL